MTSKVRLLALGAMLGFGAVTFSRGKRLGSRLAVLPFGIGPG